MDYLKGNFPKETIDVYRNRIPSLLSTPGGRTWWANRKVWFGQGFREEVDGLLASPPSASLKASVTREPGEAGPQ